MVRLVAENEKGKIMLAAKLAVAMQGILRID